MDFVTHHSYLIPLLPLIGAAIAGFVIGGGMAVIPRIFGRGD